MTITYLGKLEEDGILGGKDLGGGINRLSTLPLTFECGSCLGGSNLLTTRSCLTMTWVCLTVAWCPGVGLLSSSGVSATVCN